jgi:hypothetical protein
VENPPARGEILVDGCYIFGEKFEKIKVGTGAARRKR